MSRVLVVVPRLPWLKERPKERAGTYQWDGKRWVKVSEKVSGYKERPFFPKGVESYFDIYLGRYIKSPKHLEEVMKKYGYVELTTDDVRAML